MKMACIVIPLLQFCQLMKEERDKWELGRARDMDHELDMMRNEMEKELRQLRDELATERDVLESQIKQITCLKKVGIQTVWYTGYDSEYYRKGKLDPVIHYNRKLKVYKWQLK